MLHRTTGKSLALATLAAAAALLAPAANADIALAGRAGTLGLGVEVFKGFTDTFSIRVGYANFSLDRQVTDTAAVYNGSLKLGNFSLLADWHVLGKGFHVSAGLVQTANKINIVGVPAGGSFNLGGTNYPASSIATVRGSIKVGNSAAPYVGIGFGNAISDSKRLTFMLDLGLITTGSPEVSLSATCVAGLPAATCTQIQQSTAAEIRALQADAVLLKVWPVINLGLAFRL